MLKAILSEKAVGIGGILCGQAKAECNCHQYDYDQNQSAEQD